MPTPAPNVRRLYALVPCAGSGVRAGAPMPKQYVEIAGRPLVAPHAGGAGARCRGCSRDPGRRRARRRALRRPGGPAGRSAPRGRALRRRDARARPSPTASPSSPGSARRPTTGCWCTTPRAAWSAPSGSSALIDACRDDAVGGLLALPVADTLKREPKAAAPSRRSPRDGTCGRRRRRRCSASACCADALARSRPSVTDEAARDRGASACAPQARAGARREHQGHVPGRLRARRGAARAARRDAHESRVARIWRVGEGWDTHALVAGRKLVLGGVEIPHTHGLLGHSDADALLPRDHRCAVRRRRAGRHRPPFPRHRRAVPAAPTRSRCWPRRRGACAARAGRSATSTAP